MFTTLANRLGLFSWKATAPLSLAAALLVSSCSPSQQPPEGDGSTAGGIRSNSSGLLGRLAQNAVLQPALHYAAGASGDSVSLSLGYNLADIGNVDQLNSMPAGVKGLVFLGLCNGADSNFISTVQPFIGNPKLYGFYLMDEPDPTGQWSPTCPIANLRAESDWIHANVPGAKTFIVLMNLGSDHSPSFDGAYNPANTGIDLFGIDPYPCRPELGGCDYSIIKPSRDAAIAFGIPQSQLVPVYQAFGGGDYTSWTLPTVDQEKQILATWDSVLPNPAFDMTYAWGSQAGDSALENSPQLQPVFKQHNASAAPSPTPSPVPSPSPSVTPSPTTSPSSSPSSSPSTSPSPSPIPSATPPVAGSDTLVIQVSEDAYLGDAQFKVAVDSVQIGGILTATASHSTGASQAVSLSGSWGGGTHKVAITFLNDKYGGTPKTDRNLYVDSISYNGVVAANSKATLLSNGTKTFTVGSSVGPSPSPSPSPVPSPSPSPSPKPSPLPSPSPKPTAKVIDVSATALTTFDIQATSAVSGFSADHNGVSFNWGFMKPNALLSYSLNVQMANNYTLDISEATVLNGAAVQVLANGAQVKLISLPNTGGWGIYQDVTAAIKLPQGSVTFTIQDTAGQSVNIAGISLKPFSASPSPTPSPSPSPSPTPTPSPSPSPMPSPSPGGVGAHFDHIFMVVLENTGYSEVIANPTFAAFAKKGALMTNYSAISHPSEPNYLAMTAGTDFGITDDNFRKIDAKNIADLVEAKGLSWKSYNDAFPGGCPFGNSGTFDYNHSPLLNFADIQDNSSRCAAHIVDASQLAVDVQNGTIPNYMFYTPDINNDGHDTNVAYSANWFTNTIAPLLNNPTFMKGTLVVVYYDEDDGGGNNQIYAALVGSMVTPGSTSNTAYDHYSLLRTIEDNFGLGTLGKNDASAKAIQGIWSK